VLQGNGIKDSEKKYIYLGGGQIWKACKKQGREQIKVLEATEIVVVKGHKAERK
jgi:hypothetical protein